MSDQFVNAFGIRRLNPFNGVLQVVTTDDARALSHYGQNWEIQVLSDSPQGLWANIPFTGQQFFTFGLWSKTEGLHQVPLNPLFNTGGMLKSANRLIECLQSRLAQLPFPLTDMYELWLLDEVDDSPVALLESARSQAELEQKPFKRWSAAEPGDFSFVSQRLIENGLPEHDGHNPRVHASVLEALISARCDHNHRRAWYLRDDAITAKAVFPGEADQPADRFPDLPVNPNWHDPDDHRLIMDYVAWKAPQILLLPGLKPGTRRTVEELAVRNATQVDRLWRLLPEKHNKTLLNKARVEARIRLSSQN